MRAVERMRRKLRPGQLYRRAELCGWSSSPDRHLALLQKDHTLEKVSGGLYYCPKGSTAFGQVPPSVDDLIEAFLRDDRFLITTPSHYNSLGVGTTQLYSETVIYNHKRHGRFKLGNRTYNFVRKHCFPLKLSEEFLLVDLVDHLNRLPEDKEDVRQLVELKAKKMDRKKLLQAVREYGGISSRNFFGQLFEIETS